MLVINAADRVTDEDNKTDEESLATIDFGAPVDLNEPFRLGLIVRDLIIDEFKVNRSDTNDASLTVILNFYTEVRIGLAYHYIFFAIAVNYFLIEKRTLLASLTFDSLKI